MDAKEVDQLSVLYGDDPLEGTTGAKDRSDLVARLVRSLELMHERTDSAVIALVGPWGSGKTTVLNAVEDNLKKVGKWQTARYNPWSYPSLEGAIPGFFAELNSALPEDVRSKDTRKMIGSWVSKFSPLGGLASFAGGDLSGAIDGIAKFIAGDDSPEKLRAKISADLTKLKQPVLMLIDDLDRLGPDELLTTFRLVRMLGRLPNVYYLLCYDESTLIDVLRRTGLVDNDSGRARAYLEKMIQLRLDIPTLLVGEQLELLNLVLSEVQSNHKFELVPSESQRLSAMWGESMRNYLSQPRAVKRLFTQVDATWAEVAGEVDFPDYVAMTFIRTFEPAVFALIEEHEAELLGFYSEWDPLMNENNEAKMDRWMKYLLERGAVHPEKIMHLLSELFLPLKSARDKTHFGSEARADVGRRSGVGHQDYFHRYTQAGVPKDDLPNGKVAEALTQWRNGLAGKAADLVEEFLAKNASMVVQKIMQQDSGDLPVGPLTLVLARKYDVIGREEAGIQAGPPSFELLALGRHLFAGVEGDVAVQLLQTCSSTSSGLAFAADLLRDLSKPERGGNPPSWLPEAKDNVVAAIEVQLRKLEPNAPDDEIERAFRNVWALREFSRPTRVTQLLWELIDEDNGWNICTLVGMLYPIGRDGNGRWLIDRYHLSADQIDSLFGFGDVLSAVQLMEPSGEDPGPLKRFDSRPTLGVRAACVREDVLRLADELRVASLRPGEL